MSVGRECDSIRFKISEHAMSSLRDAVFSDIILDKSSKSNWLKGVPGAGVSLVRLEDQCPDVDPLQLEEQLAAQMLSYKSRDAIRFQFDGICFRASYVPSDIPKADPSDSSGPYMSWFLRRLPEKTPGLSDLGLPPSSAPIIEYLTHPRAHGLILFAGAQNSGKTTFGSSLVKARLEMFGGHCVTFESPAEMPLRGKHGKAGLCIQTEVDREEDLPAAIRRAHMYAQPNEIFIGEIKAPVAAAETARAALGSNNQLVVATIHGQDIVSALQRLIVMGQEIDGDNFVVNLGATLTAIFHLSLKAFDDGTKKIVINESLLIPFGGDFCTKVRAKLKNKEIDTLPQEMKSLKGLLLNDYGGSVNGFMDWGKE